MRRDRRELAAIFAGGFIGAVARAGLGEALPADPGAWPWATFAANIAGGFLLGLVAAHLPARNLQRFRFLGTGVCGALTTFSTLQLELLRMLDADRLGLALGYAGASIVLGLTAVVFATSIARRAPAAA
jgi:CrcB protein